MKRIIIDSDAGVDDLLAILLAVKSKNTKIAGIVANYGVFKQQKSRLRIESFLKSTVKELPLLLSGHSKSPSVKLNSGYKIHGKSYLNKQNSLLSEKTAFDRKNLLNIISQEPVDAYVSLGPLTSLASIINHKSFAKNVKSLYIMGGSLFHQGNITPFSEANFYFDPNAVKKVFSTNKRIVLFPLDITSTIQLKPKKIKGLAHEITINQLFSKYYKFYNKLGSYHTHPPQFKPHKYKGAAIHDCLPILSLIDNHVFNYKKIKIYTDKIIKNKGHIYPAMREKFIIPPNSHKVVNYAFKAKQKLLWKTFRSTLKIQ